ncbi:MAG TPA: sulfite exporter TauE/SafE family protein [Pyrinomonadaceae bacterium]|nr:sulfite exporter TauE/SafE family protein [Pyrinomonadaceae bacterium]
MSTIVVAALIILFFLTSVVGVVTGSNSLITVPVMFQFGIPEKEAVATNMFGLVFMAIGGTIPFVRARVIRFRRTSPLVIMTIVSSAIGAALVGFITNQSIKLIVSVAMIVVALFILVRQKYLPRRTQNVVGSPRLEVRRPAPTLWSGGFNWVVMLGYVLTFVLGIYGGLYSGGYVTILTAVFVAFLGMSFGEAVAATKWINVFSSSVATIVFMWQGLVNYKLGMILGLTMFVGAYAGAHYAAKMNDTLLRRIFLSTVVLLAAKTFYDLLF